MEEEEEGTLAKLTDNLLQEMLDKLDSLKNDAILTKAALEAIMEDIDPSINFKIESITTDFQLLLEMMMMRPTEEDDGNCKSITSLAAAVAAAAYSHCNGTKSDIKSIVRTKNSSIPDISQLEITKFPKLNGANPRDWVLKTIKYFKNHPMEDSDRVDLAMYCMEGEAYTWLNEDLDMLLCGERRSWSELVDSILIRFREPEQNHVIVDFHQLQQQGSFDDYLNIWMDLKAICSVVYPDLSEKYYLICFIGGLKEEIRSALWQLQPTTLEKAINLARMKEQNSVITSIQLDDLEAITEKDYSEWFQQKIGLEGR